MKRIDVFNKLARSSRISYIHEEDNWHEFGLKKATVLYDGYIDIKTSRIDLHEDKLVVWYGKGKKMEYSLESGEYCPTYKIEDFILMPLVIS